MKGEFGWTAEENASQGDHHDNEEQRPKDQTLQDPWVATEELEYNSLTVIAQVIPDPGW